MDVILAVFTLLAFVVKLIPIALVVIGARTVYNWYVERTADDEFEVEDTTSWYS